MREIIKHKSAKVKKILLIWNIVKLNKFNNFEKKLRKLDNKARIWIEKTGD